MKPWRVQCPVFLPFVLKLAIRSQSSSRMKFRACFGPSTLVTAAFIGPGTLTTCTRAGIQHGYELLWALAFAGLATIILQEMSARLGWVTGKGLGEAVRSQFTKPASRFVSFAIIISAILIGNAAYESGNLAGAAIGLELLLGIESWGAAIVGVVCFGLLWFGRYQWLERILIALVVIMSLCFLATAIVVKPDWSEVLRGLRPQAISKDNFLTIMGIIGTTVVPYNLFLHAAAISKKWKPDALLSDIRTETAVAVILGIGISMLIVITSAATKDQLSDPQDISNARDFAVQVEPVFGRLAQVFMGVGFFAAGLSSALTAPLAAAFAVRGLFGWEDADVTTEGSGNNDRQKGFVLTWATIVLIGILVSQSDIKLVSIILFAQVSNAIVLPFIGVFLFQLANSKAVMGVHKNKALSNVFGAFVLMVLLLLSTASVIKLF